MPLILRHACPCEVRRSQWRNAFAKKANRQVQCGGSLPKGLVVEAFNTDLYVLRANLIGKVRQKMCLHILASPVLREKNLAFDRTIHSFKVRKPTDKLSTWSLNKRWSRPRMRRDMLTKLYDIGGEISLRPGIHRPLSSKPLCRF